MRLSELRGKVVLLDFWATWCLPCEESIPHLRELYGRHRAEGLEIVGVSVDDEPGDVPAFVRGHSMSYRVLVDADKKIMDQYDVRSIPTSVLVDRAGRVRGRWLGAGEEIDRELDAAVREALAQKK